MIIIEKENFSLEQIWESGQCFRLRPHSLGGYELIAKDQYVRLWQDKEKVYIEGDTVDEQWAFHYFDLETSYHNYISNIDSTDTYLVKAAEYGSGIRILRQDIWEMIVSFLISQRNNINRIRKCIEELCTKYGEQKSTQSGEHYYAFPGPERLANLPLDQLMDCHLGYRSKYVVRSAQMVVSNQVSLEKIKTLPYIEAKKELQLLYGVGEKVADCICLFALHHLEAFPVDTHIKRVLEEHYKDGFPTCYHGIEGVLQQYIFYYEWKHKGQ